MWTEHGGSRAVDNFTIEISRSDGRCTHSKMMPGAQAAGLTAHRLDQRRTLWPLHTPLAGPEKVGPRNLQDPDMRAGTHGWICNGYQRGNECGIFYTHTRTHRDMTHGHIGTWPDSQQAPVLFIGTMGCLLGASLHEPGSARESSVSRMIPAAEAMHCHLMARPKAW